MNAACEYINDYMYFIVKPGEKGIFHYSSGVNITRFTPLTAGKHRLGQNIVMKGLQSSNLELRSFILALGAAPRTVRGTGFYEVPRSEDLWNSEFLLIEDVPEGFSPEEVIRFSVQNFLRIVLPQCVASVNIPEPLLSSAELQAYLNSLCKT
ncbi:MAG: hypothetical protein HQL01_05845 [Nitrospirae bacterium]|nr:hypothetical protein [Nitrospirota bacterium]